MIRRRNKTFLIVSAVFLVLFVLVAFMIPGAKGKQLDETMASWAAGNHSAIMENVMKYASFLGSSELVLLITVIVGLVLLLKRSWRQFFFFFVISVGGVFLNLALKLLIHRSRPGEEAEYIDVFSHQFELQSYSFPSGHTMRATIFFLFLIYLAYYAMKKTWLKWVYYVIFTLLIVAVPLSRIMLDAHFATDVLGALSIAAAWFFFCLYFFHRPKSKGLSLSFI